jgi:hypothetical protein
MVGSFEDLVEIEKARKIVHLKMLLFCIAVPIVAAWAVSIHSRDRLHFSGHVYS